MISRFHNIFFQKRTFFAITYALFFQGIMVAFATELTDINVGVFNSPVVIEQACSVEQSKEMNKCSNFNILPIDMLIHLMSFFDAMDSAVFSGISKPYRKLIMWIQKNRIPRYLHIENEQLYVRCIKQRNPALQKGLCLPRTDAFDKNIEEHIPLSDVWRNLNIRKLDFLANDVSPHADGWQDFIFKLLQKRCIMAGQNLSLKGFRFDGQKYFDDVHDLEANINAKGFGTVRRNPKKLKHLALHMHNKKAKELYISGLLNGENGIQQNRKLFMRYVKGNDRVARRIYYRSLYFGLNGFKRNYDHVFQCAVLGCERAQECLLRKGYTLEKFMNEDIHFIKYCIKKGMKMAVRYYALILSGTSFIPVSNPCAKSEKKFVGLVKKYPQEARLALSILYYREGEMLSAELSQLCKMANIKASLHKHVHFIEQQEMQNAMRLFRPKHHPMVEKLAADLEEIRTVKGDEAAVSYLNSAAFNIQLLRCYLGIRRFG